MPGPDRNRCLDELDPPAWGKPAFNSHLVTTCHRLRKKPIGAFTNEDLRIMIGQQISLEFLVPLALEVLESDPLAEGDLYTGDLLCSVLKIDPEFWLAHRELRGRAAAVTDRLGESAAEFGVELRKFGRSAG